MGAVSMKVISVAVFAIAAVLLVGAPASAVKPARGCPDNFAPFTSAQIFQMFPSVTQAQFDTFDKNGDDVVCGKRTPALFNPIDNTANRP